MKMMTSAKRGLGVAVACVLLAAWMVEGGGHDTEAEGTGVRVHFLGSSGQIQLWPKADPGKWIKIKMNRLVELRPDGSQSGCQAPNFASTDFEWTDPVPANLTGRWTGVATLVKFAAEIAPSGQCGSLNNVKFSLEALLYTVAGTAWNGNDSVSVLSDAVKFSVRVEDWPWKNTSDVLQFGIRVSTNHNDSSAEKKGVPSEKKEVVQLSGSHVDAMTRAVVDGTTAEDAEVVLTAGTKYVDLDFQFPYFSTKVEYDPVLGLDSTDSGSVGSVVSGLMFLLGLVLLALGV